jgi:hypothetical protein
MPSTKSAKSLTLIAAAVLATGGAPKKAAPAKPAPAAKPAAEAAAPAPAKAQPAGDFDARNPQNLAALLGGAGGKAQVTRQDEDSVLVTVTSTAADFSMQFAGCDTHGRACKAVLFDYLADSKTGPTFNQLNAFNQTSALCRGYEDKTGKPHVVYSTLLFAGDSQGRMTEQFRAWTGCIGEFRNFLKDPNAYLASAP